jgi:hypothetical protein
MREKNVPLDTLEIKGKGKKDDFKYNIISIYYFLEIIQSFTIEPNGHKLVVITGENLRTNVTFYKMGQGQKSGKIETLKVMSLAVTTSIWAPNGQYVVLAAMKTRYDDDF